MSKNKICLLSLGGWGEKRAKANPTEFSLNLQREKVTMAWKHRFLVIKHPTGQSTIVGVEKEHCLGEVPETKGSQYNGYFYLYRGIVDEPTGALLHWSKWYSLQIDVFFSKIPHPHNGSLLSIMCFFASWYDMKQSQQLRILVVCICLGWVRFFL